MAYTACPLVTQQGKTTIADTVVAKIAGIATREISGVHDLGAGPSRVVGALRERIPGGRVNQGQGVSVEVGERQALEAAPEVWSASGRALRERGHGRCPPGQRPSKQKPIFRPLPPPPTR